MHVYLNSYYLQIVVYIYSRKSVLLLNLLPFFKQGFLNTPKTVYPKL